MEIRIITSEEGIEYGISSRKDTSNDEITRAIAYLEIIKTELLQELNHDYEVFEKD